MKIKALMIPNPISITEKTSIKEAIEIMKVNSIRHLPVTGTGHVLVGFVTLADLRTGLIPSMVAGLTLSDLMIKNPIIVDPDSDIEIAAQLIYKHKINGTAPFSFMGILTIVPLANKPLSPKGQV